jgi:chaperone required for assembly of F1-ATPase
MQKWGHDEQAVERRAYRQGEFDAAVAILRALQI